MSLNASGLVNTSYIQLVGFVKETKIDFIMLHCIIYQPTEFNVLKMPWSCEVLLKWLMLKIDT